MDVLVLPSLFEGNPRVIMEAAAMGVPAVASDVKGNREAVVNGRTGILVPLGDVGALTAGILRLLSDRHVARGMGQEGRKLAAEHFDEEIVFAKVRAHYRLLLAKKGS
jgi:glycosyltransferase involved in cell wall biosynthesis